jgi:hypothetical protein
LKKIVVPDVSDPKAEQLYLHIKRNGLNKITNSQQSPKTQLPTGFGTLEADEVDKWIEDFWTSLPDADSHDKPLVLPHTKKQTTDTENNNSSQKITPNKEKQTILRSIKNRKLAVLLILLVFIIGFVSGFVFNEIGVIGKSGRGILSNTVGDNSGELEIRVEGKLSYKNEFGVKLPDVDATILFLPVEAQTPVPISPIGFRADNGTFDPNNDNVQRIIELGGIVQRAGANGGFAFTLKNSGNYNAILISSHLKRTNATQLPPEIVNYLRKFFRDPIELIKDYRIEKEEYNITNGTQFINQTFE